MNFFQVQYIINPKIKQKRILINFFIQTKKCDDKEEIEIKIQVTYPDEHQF